MPARRMHSLASGRIRWPTLALGAAAVGAGALLAVGKQWAAAVASALAGGLVTWLAGASLLPRGENAYCMRVGRSLREGVGRMAGSYETLERYARRQRARVERLEPPAELEKQHARLTDLLAEADMSADDPSRSLSARAADTTRSLKQASEQRAALIERDDAGARYTKAIAELAESSDSLIEGAFERAEDAVGAVIDKLDGIDPPTKLAAGHEALLERSRSYLAAMRAYHDAVRELDPDRVRAAVNKCERAKSAIKEKLTELCGEKTIELP